MTTPKVPSREDVSIGVCINCEEIITHGDLFVTLRTERVTAEERVGVHHVEYVADSEVVSRNRICASCFEDLLFEGVDVDA